MGSKLLSLMIQAPSRWLGQGHASVATVGVGLLGAVSLGAGCLLLPHARAAAFGAWPLACFGTALLGWCSRGPHGREQGHAQEAVADVAPASIAVEATLIPSVGGPFSSKDQRLALLAQSFEQSGSAMVITDALDRISLANGAFALLTGHDISQIVGQPAELLGLQPLRPTHLQGIDEAIRQGEPWSGESHVKGADGQGHDLWLTVNTVRGQDGRITHLARVFQDVTPLKAQLRQMAEQARHDSLTGLSNRRAFGELMFQAMARTRRYTKTLALMCVDLDGFKGVNDTHGHQVGDQLLIMVARRLETCVRTTDHVCRMGGDEFMLVLEGPGQTEEVTRIGERVLAAIREAHVIGGHYIHVTPSVGVAVYDGQESDQRLIQRADAAMYAAKRAGKSQMVLASDRDVQAEPLRVVSLRA